MQIEIEKEPIVTAKLNVVGFKQDLVVLEQNKVKDLDLEKAVYQNLEIIKTSNKCDIKEEDKLEDMIFHSVDWGNIIEHLKDTQQDEMTIYLTTCKVKGLQRFSPGTVDVEKGILTCEPIREDEEGYTTVLIKHTFMPLLEFHVEKMLADNILDYAEKGWKPYTNLN